ncbi:transglutaminase TgpA family protein [Lysobacter claricitrinus]|uniref:transglutaminase TgpA family protein n=1 Tax=Lysobacter claricitrinus TaxID=3367728 RepID=UPI0037DBA4FD
MADVISHPLDGGSRRWTLLVAGLCLVPLLLQLPGPTALAIAVTAVVIAALSRRKPLSTLVRALLAVAIVAAVSAQFGFNFGRDTGCALLGAMIALKPSETVSVRDGRSLVGFALFAPFSAFLLDQGPWTLVLGLVAAMLGLGALQRLTTLEGEMPAPGLLPPMRQAMRLLAYGIPLALAIFWLFPRIGTPLWGVPDRAKAKVGLSDRMSPGDWVDLLADDSVAARARFLGATPAKSAMYWRGPVLSDFDGRTWQRSDNIGLGARDRLQVGRVRWTYTLEIEPTDSTQLVALDVPLAAPEGASLSSDYSLRAKRPLATLTRWNMASSPPLVMQPDLPAPRRQHALALPAGYDPRTVALGRELRTRLHDDRAIVQYALDWIRRDFAYSLNAPPLGRDTVDDFLFRTRIGYCEHFAGSFTLLMRAAGIPTRVVTGYVGGQWNRLGGYWMIRRMDAHAWAEVWLPERGWVRVDPTAAVAPERIYDTVDDQLPAGGLLETLQGPRGLAQVGDWMRQNWNDLVLGFNADRQERLFAPFGFGRMSGMQLVLMFAIAASLALGLMVWLSLRAPREQDPVLRAWHQLGARYARIGLGRAPHEPATAWAERITKARGEAADGLRDLTARFTNSRYAAGVADEASARRLARDLRAHRPSPPESRAGRAPVRRPQ